MAGWEFVRVVCEFDAVLRLLFGVAGGVGSPVEVVAGNFSVVISNFVDVVISLVVVDPSVVTVVDISCVVEKSDVV